MTKRTTKLLILLLISFALGLLVPILWLMILNTQRSTTFLGMIPIWLVYPGYKLAASLFPDAARNESAGLTLLIPSLVINAIFYFLITFGLVLLVTKLGKKQAGG